MGQVIFWNIFLVFFLWIVVNLTKTEPVQNVPYGDFNVGQKEIEVGKEYFFCHCGKLGKTKEIYLDIKMARTFLLEAVKDKDIWKEINYYPGEIKEILDCLPCSLFTFIKCDEKGKCIKKLIKSLPTSNSNKMQNHDSTTDEKIHFDYIQQIIDSPVDSIAEEKIPFDYIQQIIDSPIVSAAEEKIPADYIPQIIDIPIVSAAEEKIPADYIPQIIDIPIGGHKNHSRLPRFVGCSYPSSMETAAITCRIYPSSIKCVQQCAFGHTLENGIKKEMKCNFKDNRWTPSGFKECVPFVDCTVTLSSGGSATCSTASVDDAPVCNIECQPYEDKSQVPMAVYKCKIDGTWEPPLPFCAIPGSGMVLAPPPRIKLDTGKSEKREKDFKL